MRRALPFRFVTAVTADTSIACATSTTAVAMSFRQPYRGGRNQWRRRFSDRSYSGERGHFVSGDSHFQSVQDANSGRRQGNGTFAHQSGLSTQYSNPIPPPPNVNHNLRFHQPVTVPGNPHILPPGDLSYNSQFHRPAPHTGNTHFMPPPNHNSQFHQPRSVSGNGQLMGSPNSYYDTQFHRPGPFSGNRQPFRPTLQRPRPRPPDFREWEYAKTPTPSDSERFIVLSYNILADYLALDHRRELYFHIPNHVLAWDWRKRNLIFELGLWSADIMCLQEVDRFSELEEELKLKGYSGVWKMRTGKAVDGCAIFWRTSRFKLVHEESIEFNKLGLRDNVAQIGVFELINRSGAPPSSLPDSNRVVICNIHVLYNPKRGEIKLGQVRVLLNRADAVSKAWDDAPVVICGDFNCTPKSPLYNFISDQKLDLSGHDRDKISGQSSAKINTPRPYNHNTGESVGGSLLSTSVLNGKEDVIPPSNSLPKLHGPDDHDSIATKGVAATSNPDTQCQKDIIVEAQSSGIGDFNDGPVASSSKTPTGVKTNDGKFLGSSEATCHSNEVPSTETSLNNLTELENLCIDESKEVRDEDDSTFLSALHDMAHDFSYDLDTSKRLIFDKSNQSSGLDSSFENSPLLHSTTEEGKDGFSPGFNFESEMTCARYDPSLWTPMERELATGKSDYTLVEHCLTLTSTYTEVEDRSQTRDLNREPVVTSYNRRFFGTVDYIWRSEDLQTTRVLAPIPKHAMQWTSGFPTKKWGSDHIALASELAFSKDVCDSTCR